MKLKLYHYWRSSSSWRVRWALAIKEVSVEFEAVNLLDDSTRTKEHLEKNPMGYVPVLEIQQPHKPTQSKLYLAESIAIIEWLNETFPHPNLLPGNTFDRAFIRQLTEIINSGTQPIQNLNVLEKHSSDEKEKQSWSQYWIRNGLTSYQEICKKTHGLFSYKDDITLADLCLIPQCYNANRFQIDLKKEFPLLNEIYERALKLETCQKAIPERFQPPS